MGSQPPSIRDEGAGAVPAARPEDPKRSRLDTATSEYRPPAREDASTSKKAWPARTKVGASTGFPNAPKEDAGAGLGVVPDSVARSMSAPAGHANTAMAPGYANPNMAAAYANPGYASPNVAAAYASPGVAGYANPTITTSYTNPTGAPGYTSPNVAQGYANPSLGFGPTDAVSSQKLYRIFWK